MKGASLVLGGEIRGPTLQRRSKMRLALSLFLSLCVQAEKRQGNRERSNEDVVSYIRSTVYEPGMVLRSKKRRIKSFCN